MKRGTICIESDYGGDSVTDLIVEELVNLGFSGETDGERSGVYIRFDAEGKKKIPAFITIKVPIEIEEEEDEEDD